MHPLGVLRELPDGFEATSSASAVLAVRSEVAGELARARYGLDSDPAWRASELGGRRALYEFDLGGRRVLVRRFSHGGLLRWLTGTRFRDPERPFRELIDAEKLCEAGIAVARILAARARRAPLGGWHLELVFERIDGARDLAAELRDATSKQRARLCRDAGELVARLHALGFVHADLHPRNLLLDGARIAVIDLDRSRWRSPLAPADRRDNLRRLLRYAERDPGITALDVARFLRAYQPDRAARRADWLAIRAEHDRARGWHALGRKLEALFGRRA